jgi:hypothetical protein
MNPKLVEFALRKQRLQIDAGHQRADLMRRLAGLDATLNTLDSVRDQFAWARRHAPLLSGGALLLLASRPRLVLRLARRGWVGWLLWRRLRGKPGSNLLPLLAPALRIVLERLRGRR